MPIALNCTCGRAMNIKDEFAGRKVRCPDCRDVITVPDPGDVLTAELIADEPEQDTRPTRSGVTSRRPAPVRDEDDEPAPVRRTPPRPPVDELPARPIVKKKARPRIRRDDTPPVVFERGWFGSTNAGMIGGLLMMVIAVVWFVVGLAAGWIFFYPPVLFVIGIIAFIKGLSSR